MPESNSPFPHLRTSGWLPFAATGLACIAIFVAWLFLSPGTLVAIIGFLVSILLGLVIATSLRKTPPSGQSSALETPFLLAHDTEVFDRYQSVGNSLLSISRQRDSIFRSVALEHLDELVRQATNIADGTFVFEGTEAWRIIYERLLRSPGLHLYRSVAWIKNANYWQDEPGRKSMSSMLAESGLSLSVNQRWRKNRSWSPTLVFTAPEQSEFKNSTSNAGRLDSRSHSTRHEFRTSRRGGKNWPCTQNLLQLT
jgi:hypothetical protein